jgi:hypothetical protein
MEIGFSVLWPWLTDALCPLLATQEGMAPQPWGVLNSLTSALPGMIKANHSFS